MIQLFMAATTSKYGEFIEQSKVLQTFYGKSFGSLRLLLYPRDCRGNIKGIIASLESLVTYILLVVWYASFVHFSTSHLILRN